MNSISKVKIQLVVFRFMSMIVLSLLIFSLLAGKVLGQCPERVVSIESGLNESEKREIQVYDSFNSDVNISDFEINIFNEITGNYLIKESDNFPSIGIENTIEFNKAGNIIQLTNVPADLNLSRCVMILIGDNCPVKKIAITSR